MNSPSSYPKKQWEKHATQYFETKERMKTIENKAKIMNQI